MSQNFDVIVIGTGPAGSTIADLCSKEGLNVASIEENGYGGTCPLRGCTPKKVLSTMSELIGKINRMEGSGIHSESKLMWNDLIQFKRTFTDPVPVEKEQSMQANGVTTFHGEATFANENEIHIGTEILRGDKIVIATGAKPTPLPIEGEKYLTHSDDFLEIESLPKRIIFIGGGYISFEFAHIAARAGADIQIIDHGSEALTGFDQDLAQLLVQQSKDLGIQVHLETAVTSIEHKNNKYIVTGEQNQSKQSWEGDMVVHGAGRVPNIDELDLDNGNIGYEKKGIHVNEYLQSQTNSSIYAAGDAAKTDGLPLTPVASMEARIVVDNIINGNQKQAEYIGIPSVAFTSPKMATVGMSEAKAKESPLNVNINYIDTTDMFTYKVAHEKYATIKTIIDSDTGLIVGAHILSDQADELINLFAMAIQLKLTTEELKKVTYAFPTAISDIPSFL